MPTHNIQMLSTHGGAMDITVCGEEGVDHLPFSKVAIGEKWGPFQIP
jgi:hypothetical protein